MNLKGLLKIALLAPLMIGLQGCTDEEVATGVGVVAIGVGVIALEKGTRDDRGSRHDRYPSCRSHSRTQCTTYYDHWGQRREECRQVYNSCDGRGRRGRWSSAGTNGVKEVSSNAALIASRLKINFAAAEKLESVFVAAESGSAAPLRALGLNDNDFRAISTSGALSDTKVFHLSRKLNLQFTETRRVLSDLGRAYNTGATKIKHAN